MIHERVIVRRKKSKTAQHPVVLAVAGTKGSVNASAKAYKIPQDAQGRIKGSPRAALI